MKTMLSSSPFVTARVFDINFNIMKKNISLTRLLEDDKVAEINTEKLMIEG